MDGHRCVECRWCTLDVGLSGDSRFYCRKDGKPLPNDVVSLDSCARFELPPASGHWGP